MYLRRSRLLRLGGGRMDLLLEVALQQESHKILGGHGRGCHEGILHVRCRLLLLLLLHHSGLLLLLHDGSGTNLKLLLLLLKIGCVYRAVAAIVVIIYSVGVHSSGSHCVAAVQLLNNCTQLLQALLEVCSGVGGVQCLLLLLHLLLLLVHVIGPHDSGSRVLRARGRSRW